MYMGSSEVRGRDAEVAVDSSGCAGVAWCIVGSGTDIGVGVVEAIDGKVSSKTKDEEDPAPKTEDVGGPAELLWAAVSPNSKE